MVLSRLNMISKKLMWHIFISSKQDLSNRDRDFIAELTSEEARKAVKSLSFILHDIIESKRYSKMLIEGTKTAVQNLLLVLHDNLPYKIICHRRT